MAPNGSPSSNNKKTLDISALPNENYHDTYLEAIKMRSNLLRSCLFSATDAASRFDLATSRPFWVRGAGWGWPRFKFVAARAQCVELKFRWRFRRGFFILFLSSPLHSDWIGERN